MHICTQAYTYVAPENSDGTFSASYKGAATLLPYKTMKHYFKGDLDLHALHSILTMPSITHKLQKTRNYNAANIVLQCSIARRRKHVPR